MPKEIRPGDSATVERLVELAQCTHRGEYDIFSTPNLVLLIEETAIEALAPSLPGTRSSVGSRVDVAHVAPTLLGQKVWATATVSVVDRRRVEFEIEVRDEIDTIATGTHERFVIDLASFDARLASKAAALK